jgi:hypothetical protein
MACETICKPVDDKLEDLLSNVQSRPSSTVFYLLLTALGSFSLVLLSFLWGLRGDVQLTGDRLGQLMTQTQVMQAQLTQGADSLKFFQNYLDRENQRQDARIQRLEDRIEQLQSSRDQSKANTLERKTPP